MDFRYAMMAPTSSLSNLNSGISGWPEMKPSPRASSSDSIGYRFASVRNNGACGWRLSAVRVVEWQREHSLARSASPRLRAAASWAHAAETAKTIESAPIKSLMLIPIRRTSSPRTTTSYHDGGNAFSLSRYRPGRSCKQKLWPGLSHRVRPEPAIGPAHRVRPLAGPMAGSSRTRWAGPMTSSAKPGPQVLPMPSLATPSKIRLGGNRDADVFVSVESSRVFGAGDLRPFKTVARINHARGPGCRERASILDGEIDLQVLVSVVGGEGAGLTPKPLSGALPCTFRGFVIDQPIAFHHVQLFGVRRAEQINHGIRPVGLDPHRVDDQRVAFVMADRVPVPRRRQLRGMRLVHPHIADFMILV